LRLVPGDELRLRYSGDAAHPAWQSVGHVVWMNFFSPLSVAFEKRPWLFLSLHFVRILS